MGPSNNRSYLSNSSPFSTSMIVGERVYVAMGVIHLTLFSSGKKQLKTQFLFFDYVNVELKHVTDVVLPAVDTSEK